MQTCKLKEVTEQDIRKIIENDPFMLLEVRNDLIRLQVIASLRHALIIASRDHKFDKGEVKSVKI